jgi:hypothetical protein
MATTVASPAEGGGVSALEEEAMVGASCRVAATALASKAAVSLFFFEEKGDGADMGTSLGGLLLGGMKSGHLVSDALL